MRSYSAWKEEYDGSRDAPIDEESMWANLAYFLQAVVPVAEELFPAPEVPEAPAVLAVPAAGGEARPGATSRSHRGGV